jgi:hypothetical protein
MYFFAMVASDKSVFFLSESYQTLPVISAVTRY